MFWSDEELSELQGTAVVGLLPTFSLHLYFSSERAWLIVIWILDKIGRVEAERDYHEKVVPAIKVHLSLHLSPSFILSNSKSLDSARPVSFGTNRHMVHTSSIPHHRQPNSIPKLPSREVGRR